LSLYIEHVAKDEKRHVLVSPSFQKYRPTRLF